MPDVAKSTYAPAVVAAAADAILIIVFAAIGRDAHQRGESVLGILATAWPFLAGATIGWLIVRAWRSPLGIWPSGVVVWLAAVAGGMILRAVTGQGIAFAFIIVATISLAVFLIGYRAIIALVIMVRRRNS
ncbi:DUF3054 domain-containing protein [Arthrobacter sp. M4]|uniref:DUF3054 domain-containing protein n=1 Tax=Arthrobacter sp. M4 TaxID=218160 RepID=UPI001CDB5862|nr:DUF3054 domain-containing protein [Arthrobacter sp. M4]MCA4131422.1 DUF3054 domain-containing protein [Arthrobacter sp. M4]